MKLKSKTIKERKPNLKFCPNHFEDEKRPHRYYNSHAHGQAIADGQGWYVPRAGKK